MGSSDRTERISRTGLAFTLAGALYLLLPFQAARTCLGMECLEFLISGLPVTLLGVPWSGLAQLLPPDPAVLDEGLYRGQLLHPTYWPRYTVVALGFLSNLFLGGTALEWLWRRRRRGLRGRP